MVNKACSGVSNFDYEAGQAPAQKIIYDVMIKQIIPKLAFSEWASIARVSKAWNGMLQPMLNEQWDNIQQSRIFGKDQWLSVPGITSVSDEPEWTEDRKNCLKEKLRQECVFFNECDNIQPHRFQNDTIKRTYQTVMVILFPEKINDELVDINLIGRLFSFEKTEKIQNNPGTVFEYITGNNPNDTFRTQKAIKSYFAVVTLDVIPNSRLTYHQTKVGLLTAKGCRVPTPLEALITNVVMNLGPSQEKKEFFFGKEGRDWGTATETDTLLKGYPLIVGAACPSGLEVSAPSLGCKDVGVVAVADIL